MSVRLDQTVTRNEQVLATDLGGEVVMMDLESGEYFNMKDTAHRIWELLEAPKTVSVIIEQLQNEYDIDAETCTSEVSAFVAELRDSGIVLIS